MSLGCFNTKADVYHLQILGKERRHVPSNYVKTTTLFQTYESFEMKWQSILLPSEMTLKQEAVKQGGDTKDELSEPQGRRKAFARARDRTDTPFVATLRWNDTFTTVPLNNIEDIIHVLQQFHACETCFLFWLAGGGSRSLDPQFARLLWNIKLGPRRGHRS